MSDPHYVTGGMGRMTTCYNAKMTDPLENIDAYTNESRSSFEDMLARLVNIPTVSADPAHAADIERGVQLAVEYLNDFNFIPRVVQTQGNPIVYGELIQDTSY